MKAESIKAVFFDHDDTIVMSWEAKWEQHKFVAEKHFNIILTDEIMGQHYGKPFPELIKVLYQTDNPDPVFEILAQYREIYPKVVHPESASTLAALHSMGKLTGILTATTRAGLDYDLLTHGITPDLVDYTQTADESDFHKPNPRVFEPAIAWLAERHIKPNEVVYVGDSFNDMEAAVGAGLSYIGVETGLVTRDQFASRGAISIKSVAELMNHIKG